MVSKHVCGYEQKITRIYDYGYTYDKRGNLVKEEEICSPTTTGPKNITVATYLYDETNRMVWGTNKAGEVSAYVFFALRPPWNVLFAMSFFRQRSHVSDDTSPSLGARTSI